MRQCNPAIESQPEDTGTNSDTGLSGYQKREMELGGAVERWVMVGWDGLRWSWELEVGEGGAAGRQIAFQTEPPVWASPGGKWCRLNDSPGHHGRLPS